MSSKSSSAAEEVVILKNNDGLAEGPFTCDEIYNDGGRLVAEPTPEIR